MPTINFTNATGSITYEESNVTPPNPNPEPPNPGPGEGWTPPSYLRTDTDTEATPDLPKPGYLTQFIDPVFHTKIIRVGGDPGTAIKNIDGAKWGDVSRHHYNSDQAWSWDQKYLYFEDGSLVLDGESYEPLFKPKNRPSDSDVRWWQIEKEKMLVAHGSKLSRWDPKSGDVTLIKDFGNGYEGCKFGPWEGSPTEDGHMVVISCNQGGFAYDITADKKYPNIDDFSNVGNVRISPLGTYIIWGCEPDHVTVTDLEGTRVTDIPDNTISHFDTCIDQAGDEVIVGRNNGTGGGQSGQLIKIRLRDGKRTELNEGGWCSHTSSRSLTHKYAVSAPTDEGGGTPPPYTGEVIMSALDGSKTWRLGHTHENPDGYDYAAQTQPSHSPDGGRVIFASAWGASSSRPVQSYVIDFRT